MFLSNGLLGGKSSNDTLNGSNSDLNSVAHNVGGFVPNGLLGTPDTDEMQEGAVGSSGNGPSMLSFVSNGLLGGSLLEPSTSANSEKSRDSLESSDETAATFSLLNNGLLGGLDSSSLMASKNLSGPESSPPESSNGLSFVSNGLLSQSRVETTIIPPFETGMSFVSNGLLSQSQEVPPMDAPPLSNTVSDIPMISSRSVTSTSTFSPLYSVRAVDFEGKTIYFRKKQKKITPSSTRSTTRPQIGKLLDVPVHKMMEELSNTTITRIQQATEAAVSDSAVTGNYVEDTLWVDRYRPQRFTELIGNERVARETMSWVKQWDWCVFGKRAGKKRPRDADEADEPDEYRRPREKILLLSGPPGLGKTTLAHVVAQQAGYQVMEINASDARSGQIVDDRIQPALESGSAVGSAKPVLVVIDEIDGATGAGDYSASFVHKLLQLIQDKPRKKQHRGQKRDVNVKRPILRPIICICNDANASSLSRLKPVAYHVRFSRPADIHVIKRLREICATESLKAETRALSALVGIARGDLRGCLNTLQFIKTRREEVTESIIRKATLGMKEAETSVLTILNNLFSPMTKKRVKELGMNEEEEGRYVSRLSQEVDGSGRESGIATGCFAHYATFKRHDATFARYEKAIEWLMTFDRFSASMYSDGDFALIPYIPYTLVAFHPLFQERGNPRVERDNTDWEQLQITRSNEEIYKTLSHCLRSAAVHQNGDYRLFATYPTLQLEFTPYINRIISPPLRPVNSQIIRPEEKAVMTRLVDIMSSLGLRFIQERAEDGQLTYRIDPAIDVFITYDGKRAADILVSRYAVRHLVAQEIDARITTRDVEFVEKGKQPKGGSANPLFASKRTINETTKENITNDTERPQKRAKSDKVDDKIDIADRPPTDFFGRPITHSTKPKSKASKASPSLKQTDTKFRVAFKFVEGNSAAVRKPIKVSAFL